MTLWTIRHENDAFGGEWVALAETWAKARAAVYAHVKMFADDPPPFFDFVRAVRAEEVAPKIWEKDPVWAGAARCFLRDVAGRGFPAVDLRWHFYGDY